MTSSPNGFEKQLSMSRARDKIVYGSCTARFNTLVMCYQVLPLKAEWRLCGMSTSFLLLNLALLLSLRLMVCGVLFYGRIL